MTAREDKEKEKTRRENLSKFVYQLAHTCFTAMVIVAAVALVLDVDKRGSYALLLGLGVFATLSLALFADNILKKNNYGRYLYYFRRHRYSSSRLVSLVFIYQKWQKMA